MDNQQWPGQPTDPPSPWSKDDPTWRPPHFQDKVARDPRQPFGTGPGRQAAVPDLRPPRKPVWPWVTAIVVAIAGVLVFLAVQPSPEGTQPSEQPPATAFPSPSVTGNALPYEGNGTGVVEATAHRWTGEGLEVDYRITSDDGDRRFAFFAFRNDTREQVVPEDDEVIEVSPGTDATGTLRFPIDRGDVTLVLTTAHGRPITALAIPG